MANESEPSSIGKVGIPYFDNDPQDKLPGNMRIKYFCPVVIDMGDALTVDYFNANVRLMERMAKSNGASRITSRFLVRRDQTLPGRAIGDSLAEPWSHDGTLVLSEEARIPLQNRWRRYDIVYMGANVRERYNDDETLEAEDGTLSGAQNKGFPQERISRLKEDGTSSWSYSSTNKKKEEESFSIRFVDGVTLKQEEADRLVRLYKEAFNDNYLFPLNEKNIRKIFEKKDEKGVRVVIMDSKGQIVSASVLEADNIGVILENGKEDVLRLREVSESATFSTHTGFGLNDVAKYLMFRAKMATSDVIYGEARALGAGSVIVNSRLGMKPCGRLHQHCVIAGKKDDTTKETDSPFGDLFVMSLDMTDRRYGYDDLLPPPY